MENPETANALIIPLESSSLEPPAPAPAPLNPVSAIAAQIRQEVHKVIVGQDEIIDQILICLFAEGHALLEGVPGTAKTLLIKTLAKVIGASFNRIQFTPDLMPSDITGTNIFNLTTSQFTLRYGPVFTDLLLADEINRTPPKTQAALLEAMQEYAHLSFHGKFIADACWLLKKDANGKRYQILRRFSFDCVPAQQQGLLFK